MEGNATETVIKRQIIINHYILDKLSDQDRKCAINPLLKYRLI